MTTKMISAPWSSSDGSRGNAELIVPETGMHTDVPASLYHACWAAANQSSLKKFCGDDARPPAGVKYDLENPKPPSAAMEKGTALHARVIQPELFDDLVTLGPTATRRSNKWKDMKKARPDLCFLEAPEMQAVVMMADSLIHHPSFRLLFDSGFDWTPEVAICADLGGWYPLDLDPRGSEFTIRAKGLLDFWLEELGWYIDLKTTSDASPDGFRKSIYNFGYDFQAAYYERLLAAHGKELKRMIFAIVENKPPYLAAVREMEPASFEKGRAKLERPMAIWHQCVTSGDWPGYSDDIEFTGVPDWALRR